MEGHSYNPSPASLASFWSKLQANNGVFQISASGSGSRSRWAIAWIELLLRSSGAETDDYGFWTSDEGYLYPPAWPAREFSLQRLIFTHPSVPEECWRLALEAVQSGLFRWVLVRASRNCAPAFGRKLQIESERLRCQVLVLSRQKLPHWILKASVEVEDEADSVFANASGPDWFQRSVSQPYSRDRLLSQPMV